MGAWCVSRVCVVSCVCTWACCVDVCCVWCVVSWVLWVVCIVLRAVSCVRCVWCDLCVVLCVVCCTTQRDTDGTRMGADTPRQARQSQAEESEEGRDRARGPRHVLIPRGFQTGWNSRADRVPWDVWCGTTRVRGVCPGHWPTRDARQGADQTSWSGTPHAQARTHTHTHTRTAHSRTTHTL
jgi:hypothetical protein